MGGCQGGGLLHCCSLTLQLPPARSPPVTYLCCRPCKGLKNISSSCGSCVAVRLVTCFYELSFECLVVFVSHLELTQLGIERQVANIGQRVLLAWKLTACALECLVAEEGPWLTGRAQEWQAESQVQSLLPVEGDSLRSLVLPCFHSC